MHWFAIIVCFSGMAPEEETEAKFPCLLLLDSLEAGSANLQLFRIIRSYLSSEWHARKHTPRSFSGQTMPGLVLKVSLSLTSSAPGVSPCVFRFRDKPTIVTVESSSCNTSSRSCKTFQPTFAGTNYIGQVRRTVVTVTVTVTDAVIGVEWFPVSKVTEKRQHIRSLLITLHNEWQTSLGRKPLQLPTPPRVVAIEKEEEKEEDPVDAACTASLPTK